ncbi:MAG: zf-TFIIB domain-containing protein [Cyanobacteria bacterium J06631_9]
MFLSKDVLTAESIRNHRHLLSRRPHQSPIAHLPNSAVPYMKCPICHTDSLNEVSLSDGLLAHQCTRCFGHWISSERYWNWLDYREQSGQSSAAPVQSFSHSSSQSSTQPVKQSASKPSARAPINLSYGLLPVVDNTTANFCADCSRLMTKSKVGRGLSFYLDRCSHCHGVWLDQNEWENLVQMNLHHQIHYMFSSAWQFSVRQERIGSRKTPA